jgi:hypothetical protein
MQTFTVNTPFDYIHELKDKPAMFWGNKKSLAYIDFYIRGFYMGRRGTGVPDDEKTVKFLGFSGDGFNEFVAKRFNISTSQTWYNIIEFVSLSNDDEAFKTFYNLLDEFFSNK